MRQGRGGMLVPATVQPPPTTVKDEVTSLLTQLQGVDRPVAVVDGASLGRANDALKQVNKIAKQISDKRMSLTRPLDAAKRGIMELFMPLVLQVSGCKQNLKFGIKNYLFEQEEKARQARMEAEKLTQTGGIVAKAQAEEKRQEASVIADVKVDKRVIRRTWRAVVVQESRIPRMYLTPDLRKLKNLANINEGLNPPDGVIFEEVR